MVTLEALSRLHRVLGGRQEALYSATLEGNTSLTGSMIGVQHTHTHTLLAEEANAEVLPTIQLL